MVFNTTFLVKFTKKATSISNSLDYVAKKFVYIPKYIVIIANYLEQVGCWIKGSDAELAIIANFLKCFPKIFAFYPSI